MKALSVKPLWATAILQEVKTVEWRSWSTDYRGPLLICASSSPWYAGSICKHALCIVELIDVAPFTKKHLNAALMDEIPEDPGYAWVLGAPTFIKPFEIKGKLKLYDVDDALIEPKDDDTTFVAFAETYYKPLVRWSDREVPERETRENWGDWMKFLSSFDEAEPAE